METTRRKEIMDAWLQEHRGILFKVVRANAFTPQDQDDLFQEICLHLWRSIPNFRGEAKASTWIYRVALYTAATWVRAEQKQPPTDPLPEGDYALRAQDEVEDDRLRWLYEQIGQLDPIDRSVCLLLLDGFSYREMAGLVGISESHIGVKIHRIKQRLGRKAKEKPDGV